MIEINEVSPNNEEAVAKRLAASIRAAWPDIASSTLDSVTIAVGLQTLRDIDLFVTIELSEPRPLLSRLRRDGSRSPEASVQAVALVIEVKQLDESRFTIVGTQIFPDYGRLSSRSVNAQIDDCRIALRKHRARYDVDDFFVHGVGWLTGVPTSKLDGVSPWIVGAEAGWLDILDAAAQQSPALYGRKPPSYVRAIATIRETLTRKRAVTPRDRKKSNDLCQDVIVDELIDELAAIAGHKQIRLTGRGGSGKTTTLALLAKRLALVNGERVLILTFHKTLRSDIEHLIDTLVDVPGVKARNISVETATTFFISALTELGVALPVTEGGVDFKALPELLAHTQRAFSRDPIEGEAALLKAFAPERFAWDYVFIDEAQDWTDAERDFIPGSLRKREPGSGRRSRAVGTASNAMRLERRSTESDAVQPKPRPIVAHGDEPCGVCKRIRARSGTTRLEDRAVRRVTGRPHHHRCRRRAAGGRALCGPIAELDCRRSCTGRRPHLRAAASDGWIEPGRDASCNLRAGVDRRGLHVLGRVR